MQRTIQGLSVDVDRHVGSERAHTNAELVRATEQDEPTAALTAGEPADHAGLDAIEATSLLVRAILK